MVFSNLIFLGFFLPVVLGLYFLVYHLHGRISWLNGILLAASLFFYAWGEPLWICAMLLTASLDYWNGRRMDRYRGQWQAKAALWGSIVFDLGVLFCFKYLGFAVEVANGLLPVTLPVPQIEMPIGISFYTFQSLSYLLDLYWGKVEVQRRYSNYLLYIAMFPQLVAGPIVRYADIAQQLERRVITLAGFQQGVSRFVCGLSKKVILANYAGEAAALLLDGNVGQLSVAGAWLGILLYAFQIYFDFSGYSDMAIGLGRMFGFCYHENFRYPYLSTSVTDFWRRWHISLGFFFRDYVYIPLGGNRRHQLRNILIVWALTGLWHGASWNFVAWGLYYGCMLLIEKKFLLGCLREHRLLGWCCTAVVVLWGWALFYYTDWAQLQQFLLVFLGLRPGIALWDLRAVSVVQQYFWLLPVLAVGATHYPARLWQRLQLGRLPGVNFTGLLALGLLCVVLLVGQSYNPFLYFRF